jgi:hypothetical protein
MLAAVPDRNMSAARALFTAAARRRVDDEDGEPGPS